MDSLRSRKLIARQKTRHLRYFAGGQDDALDQPQWLLLESQTVAHAFCGQFHFRAFAGHAVFFENFENYQDQVLHHFFFLAPENLFWRHRLGGRPQLPALQLESG